MHLGFPLLSQDDTSFEVQVGASRLKFQTYDGDGSPFYHFAFNIPKNLFQAAKEWAKTRVVLNTEDGEDEVYFQSIDASSLYFQDPSGNIVELIARHSVSCASDNSVFSAEEILSIGEISTTTNDMITVGKHMLQLGFPVMRDEPLEADNLNFIGEYDDGAFFLLVPRKRRWYISNRESEIYPVVIALDDGRLIKLNEKGEMNT